MAAPATLLCRDCGRLDRAILPEDGVCPACGSARLVHHAELTDLAVAHLDCDAYYAAIEKRDHPELAGQPLIVGGRGERGVVTTACYLARRYGVRSAMPMARARLLCPEAVVLPPDMAKYQREAARIRELMRGASPVVEPISIDEAYLDFGEAPSRADEPPARSLARLALLIERRIGITVSIGLAPNKLLAKLASDLGKPRGFRVIGRGDALAVIGPLPVSALPGVGPVMARRLEERELRLVSDLWSANPDDLVHRFGVWARRLIGFARGEDPRKVNGGRRRAVSIAAETTFERDLRRLADIEAVVRRLCDKLAERLAAADVAAGGLTLKLRRADRRTITRACRIHQPTRRAEILWHAARPVLAGEVDGSGFRLAGVTASPLLPGRQADPPDLFAGLL